MGPESKTRTASVKRGPRHLELTPQPERSADTEPGEIAKWDPAFVASINEKIAPLAKRYFRSEVRGLEKLPAGRALLVSNHSGGALTPDVLVFCTAFYDEYGYQRPVYTLTHDQLYMGPLADWLPRAGLIHATREAAAEALRSNGLVLVFPGGDHDSYRPTSAENVIDFNGRTGYVRTAIEARAPIVPMVSIGAQEGQLFLARGEGLAKRLGLERLRVGILPLSVGFPFGFSLFMFPPNLPLPTKIVTQVLEPINVSRKFGKNADVEEVDAYVRDVMQAALGELAKQRRFPIIG